MYIYSPCRSVLFYAFAFWLMAGLIACGEDNEPTDETNNLAQALEAQEYDGRSFISFDDMNHWSEDQNNPKWRDIEVISEEDKEIRITIYADRLNEGFVPVDENSGVYPDEKSLLDTQIELLGINHEIWENWTIELVQTGSTHRFVVDEDAETVNNIFSFGEFILDWLIDENGLLIVDGEPYRVQVDKGFDNSSRNGGPTTYQAGISSSEGTLSDSDEIQLSSGSLERSSNGVLILESSRWRAELGAASYFYFVTQYIRSKIDNFERDGASTEQQCFWWIFGCETIEVKADRMQLENLYFTNTYGQLFYPGYAEEADVDHLKLGIFGARIGPMCTRGTVEDGGNEDSVIGEYRTDFFEIECRYQLPAAP